MLSKFSVSVKGRGFAFKIPAQFSLVCRRWGANQVDCCSSWPSLPRRQDDRWLDSEVASADKMDNIDLTRDPSPPRKRTREEQEMLIVSKGKHIPGVRSPCANKKPLADRFANDPKYGGTVCFHDSFNPTLSPKS